MACENCKYWKPEYAKAADKWTEAINIGIEAIERVEEQTGENT